MRIVIPVYFDIPGNAKKILKSREFLGSQELLHPWMISATSARTKMTLLCSYKSTYLPYLCCKKITRHQLIPKYINWRYGWMLKLYYMFALFRFRVLARPEGVSGLVGCWGRSLARVSGYRPSWNPSKDEQSAWVKTICSRRRPYFSKRRKQTVDCELQRSGGHAYSSHHDERYRIHSFLFIRPIL